MSRSRYRDRPGRDAAVGRRDQPHDGEGVGALAAAALADHAEDLALAERVGDAVDGGDPAVLGLEPDGEILDGQDRLHKFRRPPARVRRRSTRAAREGYHARSPFGRKRRPLGPQKSGRGDAKHGGFAMNAAMMKRGGATAALAAALALGAPAAPALADEACPKRGGTFTIPFDPEPADLTPGANAQYAPSLIFGLVYDTLLILDRGRHPRAGTRRQLRSRGRQPVDHLPSPGGGEIPPRARVRGEGRRLHLRTPARSRLRVALGEAALLDLEHGGGGPAHRPDESQGALRADPERRLHGLVHRHRAVRLHPGEQPERERFRNRRVHAGRVRPGRPRAPEGEPGFWQEGYPCVDEVVFDLIPDPQTQISAFRQGNADIVILRDRSSSPCCAMSRARI